MKGRGDVLVGNVLSSDFGIESSFFPHPRHADIVRWPDNEVLIGQKALRLANSASVFKSVPSDFPL